MSHTGRTSWGRWAALFFAFSVEYYLIIAGVDAQLVAARRGGLWHQLLDFELLSRAVFLCCTCALVLVRPTRNTLRKLEPTTERKMWVAHAGSFGIFWLTTRLMFASDVAPPGPVLLWLAAWAAWGVVSAVTLTVGLIGIPHFGGKALVGSLLFGVALAWLTAQIGGWSQSLWQPFSRAALAMAAFWLRLFFANVYTDFPNYVLELDGFRVHIEAGCSGLESMGMVSFLTLAYLGIFRRQLRFPRAFLLLPIGVTLAWLCNGVRLAVMVWIGARFGTELAIGGFHSKAGWVFFSAISVGLAFLGHHSPWFSKATPETEGALESRLTTAFLLPMLVLLAVALVTGMLGHSEGIGYALRMALCVLTLTSLWHAYGDLRWRAPGAPLACAAGVVLGLGWLATGWPFPHETPAPGTGGVWLVVRALGFSTVVPIAEELAFRGYLLRVLQNRRFEEVPYRSGPWWAVMASSLVFGALHERWLAATVAGALYALLQVRGGRLRDAVLAHAATNATLAIVALAYQNPGFFG